MVRPIDHSIERNPYLDPATPRAWLLDTEQAEEVDGRLVLRHPASSVAVAGFALARETKPRRFSDVFTELSGEHPPLSDEALAFMGCMLADSYPAQENMAASPAKPA